MGWFDDVKERWNAGVDEFVLHSASRIFSRPKYCICGSPFDWPMEYALTLITRTRGGFHSRFVWFDHVDTPLPVEIYPPLVGYVLHQLRTTGRLASMAKKVSDLLPWGTSIAPSVKLLTLRDVARGVQLIRTKKEVKTLRVPAEATPESILTELYADATVETPISMEYSLANSQLLVSLIELHMRRKFDSKFSFRKFLLRLCDEAAKEMEEKGASELREEEQDVSDGGCSERCWFYDKTSNAPTVLKEIELCQHHTKSLSYVLFKAFDGSDLEDETELHRIRTSVALPSSFALYRTIVGILAVPGAGGREGGGGEERDEDGDEGARRGRRSRPNESADEESKNRSVFVIGDNGFAAMMKKQDGSTQGRCVSVGRSDNERIAHRVLRKIEDLLT